MIASVEGHVQNYGVDCVAGCDEIHVEDGIVETNVVDCV